MSIISDCINEKHPTSELFSVRGYYNIYKIISNNGLTYANVFNGMTFEQNMPQTSSTSVQVCQLTTNYIHVKYTCTV